MWDSAGRLAGVPERVVGPGARPSTGCGRFPRAPPGGPRVHPPPAGRAGPAQGRRRARRAKAVAVQETWKPERGSSIPPRDAGDRRPEVRSEAFQEVVEDQGDGEPEKSSVLS
ncbi:hypothetical protein GCM10010256_37530 [Streptomyces coeruleorubidus]|nr:hypothetical protein GCM10010256_37530 [Streptomyces coeruleorubidus]